MSYTLITGATGGLGKEFAKICALKGENLILTARDIKKLEALKHELLSLSDTKDINVYACDMSQKASRDELFNQITADSLLVSKLINVAGVDTQKAFSLYTREKLLFQTRVNFESVVDLTYFTLKNRPANSRLEILTISSLCGATAVPYFAIYSATKSSLITFMRALSYELKGENVTVTTVLPGSIPTRPDIIEDIKIQGLQGKLSKKSPAFVAQKSLKALKKRKKIYVPGAYNKLVYFLSKITPKIITEKIMARKFSRKQKDAF